MRRGRTAGRRERRDRGARTSSATQRAVALIETLSPDQRDVLLLRIVADLSLEQTAKVLGQEGRRGQVAAAPWAGRTAADRRSGRIQMTASNDDFDVKAFLRRDDSSPTDPQDAHDAAAADLLRRSRPTARPTASPELAALMAAGQRRPTRCAPVPRCR